MKRLMLFITMWLSLGCSQKIEPNKTAPVDRSNGQLPLLEVVHFSAGAIEVDGILDEPAWKSARSSGPFVSPSDGRPVPGSPVAASARMGWDDKMLYFGFEVTDPHPASPFKRDDVDPHLWERASAVELMVQPGDPGDNRNYYEIQVDVAGAVWDTRFDDYNRPITGSGANRRFGHQDYKSGVQRAVKVSASGYTVEMAVPFGSLGSPRTSVPPKAGDVWRINMYAFRDGQRHSVAWSPLRGQGNFHRASRFGKVKFLAR